MPFRLYLNWNAYLSFLSLFHCPRVKHIEDEIKELQKNKENEVEGGGESQPETTYEEKVKQEKAPLKLTST